MPNALDRLAKRTAVQGSFFDCCSCPTSLLVADNPAATTVIRSLILLGARRDARDLSQERDLPRGAAAVRNACLAADSWSASRNTFLARESKGSSHRRRTLFHRITPHRPRGGSRPDCFSSGRAIRPRENRKRCS